MRADRSDAQGDLQPARARRRRTRRRTCARSAATEHGWIGPFVMATYNTRIVRRSSELLGYGPDFRYREVSALLEPGRSRSGMTAGPRRARRRARRSRPPARCSTACSRTPARARARRRARTATSGSRSTAADDVAKVAAKGDPGYKATALMMGEAALCLALTEGAGGVHTPASAMGEPLVERLRAAGMTLTSPDALRLERDRGADARDRPRRAGRRRRRLVDARHRVLRHRHATAHVRARGDPRRHAAGRLARRRSPPRAAGHDRRAPPRRRSRRAVPAPGRRAADDRPARSRTIPPPGWTPASPATTCGRSATPTSTARASRSGTLRASSKTGRSPRRACGRSPPTA